MTATAPAPDVEITSFSKPGTVSAAIEARALGKTATIRLHLRT